MFHSPFEQFKVLNMWSINYNVSISNVILQIITVLIMLMGISYYTINTKKHKYNLSIGLNVYELIYSYVFNTIKSHIGKKVHVYFPYLLFLFVFIFIFNLVGLLPYGFTVTSNLSVALGLGFMTWFGILLIGLREWGIKYFALYCPHGASVILLLILPPIEFISTTFRVFSLSLRLFANIVAGHILLECIMYFTYKLVYMSIIGYYIGLIGAIVGLALIIVLLLFEACVALLQAYIFTILSCLYLREVL